MALQIHIGAELSHALQLWPGLSIYQSISLFVQENIQEQDKKAHGALTVAQDT